MPSHGPKLKVKNTKRTGLGVFAAAKIKAGTVVIEYSGRPRWVWEMPRWCWEHSFQVGYDRYVVPRAGSPGWSVNHSCEPNCWVQGERAVVAMRDIRRGEEVTFDYSTNVGWDGFSMACSCGAKRCRRTVTSYRRLGPGLKERYRGHVSPFLLKEPKRQRPSLF